MFSFYSNSNKKNAAHAAEKLRKKLHKYLPIPEEEINTKRLSIHAARHTAATLQYQAMFEKVLESNRQLLGHKVNSTSTKLYTHVNDEMTDFNIYIDNIFLDNSLELSNFNDQVICEAKINQIPQLLLPTLDKQY